MKATILSLGLYPSSGGPSKSIPAFQRALQANVISWEDSRQSASEPSIWTNSLVVEANRLPVFRQLLVPERRNLAAAERLIAESSIVSVHGFWRWHAAWLRKVACRHRVPYWFVPHGALDPYVFQHGRLAKTAFMTVAGRRFLENASGVVCSTSREYDKLRHLMPSQPHAVVFWPLDSDDFRERDLVSRSETRRILGIPDAATCLLFLGRLHPMKRPLETIEAVARSGRSDVHLMVAGGDAGVTAHDCRVKAKAVGIEARIHVLGAVRAKERIAAIDAADAFISLSHRENFNYAAAESLASGLPVILSPGNDLAGDLADAACGWFLKTIDDAASTISEVASMSRDSLSQAGNRGREWASAKLRFATFRSQIGSFAERISR